MCEKSCRTCLAVKVWRRNRKDVWTMQWNHWGNLPVPGRAKKCEQNKKDEKSCWEKNFSSTKIEFRRTSSKRELKEINN